MNNPDSIANYIRSLVSQRLVENDSNDAVYEMGEGYFLFRDDDSDDPERAFYFVTVTAAAVVEND